MKSLKPPPLEKAFQAKVVKRLKTLPRSWFVKVSDRAKSGIPDILICVNGHFVAWELKRDEAEQPTPLQLYTLGLIGVVARGVAKVVNPQNFESAWEELVELSK